MRLILVFPKKFEFYKLLRVLTFDPDFDLVDMVQIEPTEYNITLRASAWDEDLPLCRESSRILARSSSLTCGYWSSFPSVTGFEVAVAKTDCKCWATMALLPTTLPLADNVPRRINDRSRPSS